eukprot:gene9879-12120_t
MCKTIKYIVSGGEDGKNGFKNSLGGWFSIEGKYLLHKKEGRLLASIHTNTDTETIICFPEIRAHILTTIINYCTFHSQQQHQPLNQDQINEFNTNLLSQKQSNLCELASASYYLDVKSLVSLTSKEIASQISSNHHRKSTEDIRETFSCLQLDGFSSRIYKKKSSSSSNAIIKKENSKDNLKQSISSSSSSSTPPPQKDSRTLDELLEFLGEDPKSKSNNNNNNNKKKKNNNKSLSQKSSSNNNNKSSPLVNNQQQQQQQLQKSNNKSNNNQNINNNISVTTKKNFNELKDKEKVVEDLNNNNNNKINNNDDEDEDVNSSSLGESEDDDLDLDLDDDDVEDVDIDPDIQKEIDNEIESFKERLDSFSKQSKPKLTLPSSTMASLLDVY